jgi:predicted phage-related endonuclease
MIFYRIERDEETIAAMRAAAVDFWTNNVLARVPPDPQTMRDLTLQMMKKPGRPVALDSDHMAKLQQLAEVRGTLNALAGTEEELAFAVGDYVCKEWGSPNPYLPPIEAKKAGKKAVAFDPMSDAGLYFNGERIASWNKQRGAHLDQGRLKEEKPDVVAEYTKQHFFRVLRFHKPKGA